jgi:hypothetical protein
VTPDGSTTGSAGGGGSGGRRVRVCNECFGADAPGGQPSLLVGRGSQGLVGSDFPSVADIGLPGRDTEWERSDDEDED